MKHKSRLRRKLKNTILKAITLTAVLVFLLFATSDGADPWIVCVIEGTCAGWIFLFGLANGLV